MNHNPLTKDSLFAKPEDNIVQLCHERLENIDGTSFRKLFNNNMVENSPNVEVNSQKYKPCKQVKQTKLYFKRYDITTARPLELIHSDVCGPVFPQCMKVITL